MVVFLPFIFSGSGGSENPSSNKRLKMMVLQICKRAMSRMGEVAMCSFVGDKAEGGEVYFYRWPTTVGRGGDAWWRGRLFRWWRTMARVIKVLGCSFVGDCVDRERDA